MDITEIEPKYLQEIIAKTGFDYDLIVKDYYITLLLYLLKDIEGLCFKGGTALQKIFLNYSRISEDIDFTLIREIEEVKKKIIAKIDASGFFGTVTKDKVVHKFTRLIVPYESSLSRGQIFIDLNERGNMQLEPVTYTIHNLYPNIPRFGITCLSQKEMVAEKVAAAIARNKPRDHYDIYQIIKQGIPIDTDLVRRKCELSGLDPSIPRMFNRAKVLYKRWNEDLLPLLVEEITYHQIMKTLAEYFNLKEEKEKLKDSRLT